MRTRLSICLLMLKLNGGESCLNRALKGVSPKVGWGRGNFENWFAPLTMSGAREEAGECGEGPSSVEMILKIISFPLKMGVWI